MTPRDLLAKLEEMKASVSASLIEINELDGACKSLLKHYTLNPLEANSTSIIKVQAVIDYMYEKVNIGNWKEVKVFLRKTITIASYLKLLLQIANCNEINEKLIKEWLKTIDFGILFGCPLDNEPNILQKCASIVNAANLQQTSPSSTCKTLSELVDTKNSELRSFEINFKAKKYGATPLPVLDCPSMEYFFKNYIMTETPVLLENCINHWPALQKWKDQNYFISLAGLRTVSVELGNKYTDTDWTQKLMTIEEFIKHHIYLSEGPTGYLAQYQLFNQIPELKNDIIEPEYCCFADSTEPVDIMAWYGPKGTVSPLHHDPKKNLLAQVIGEKQIFLFAPTDSEYLYPHEHELLNNTAHVDPREPDLEKYPNYKEATAYYCILKPGQMLFIPPKWWHFVESLSISFSVSFWWE